MFGQKAILTLFYMLTCLDLLSAIEKDEPNACSKKVEISNYEQRKQECHRNYYNLGSCLVNLEKERYEDVFYCCEGYVEVDGRCNPHCPSCVHGKCVAPGNCTDCSINFGGENCDKSCDAGKFGLNCENDCNCILTPNCNKNYTYCACNSTDSTEMSADCKKICHCRFNICHPGFIGQNCTVECPNGTFGNLCSKKCSCVMNNTIECNKEDGYCRCKDRFYGVLCENECTGVLKCPNNNSINCTCELSVEQKIVKTHEDGRAHVEQRVKETKDHFEQKLDEIRGSKNNLVVCLIGLLVVVASLCLLVFHALTRTKKLKNELRTFSVRYVRNEFGNPFYETSLATKSNEINSGNQMTDSRRNRLIRKLRIPDSIRNSNLVQKIDDFAGNLHFFKYPGKKNSGKNANLIEENKDNIYTTINEIKNKANEEAIKMPEDDK